MFYRNSDSLFAISGGIVTATQKRQPLLHLPWVIRQAFHAAPSDAVLNLIAAVLGGVAPGVTLVFAKRAINAVSTGAPLSTFLVPVLWLAVVLVLNEAVQSLAPLFSQRMISRAWAYLELMVLRKSSSLSLSQFDESGTYDLMERASNAIGPGVTDRVFATIPRVVSKAAGILSALSILLAASPWLALIGSLVIVPDILVQTRAASRNYERNKTLTPKWRYNSYLTALLTERAPATELRAYQLPRYFVKIWRENYWTICQKIFRVNDVGLRENEISLVFQIAASSATLLLVGRMVSRGEAGLGDAVALTGALTLLNMNISEIAWLLSALWGDLLPIADLHEFLGLPTGESSREQGVPFPTPLTGAIRFEGVSFHYPGRPAPVLDNITLTIAAGQKIALVGPNGAGKSTLVKLLLGLYHPTAGRITIGGVDLRDIAPTSLRDHVSCIFQDFVRFDLTVRDNVAVGRLGSSSAEVAAAGEAAGLTDVVDALPAGYDTMLGKTFKDGTDLSGGQWQRVALARAFVRGADLIILDEPTAALDARSELNLFGKFVDLVAGKTAVLISHRLGVARLADRIIVLADGRIAEDGAHAELLAVGGLYASLFQAQAQWYESSGERTVEQA